MSNPMIFGALELLLEIKKLLELHGENPFKVRALDRAVKVLESRKDLIERIHHQTLIELPGIGSSIVEMLTEYVSTGQSTVRDTLRTSLPLGLEELAQVRGLGPKRARTLIEQLGIHSLVELEYACRENRLLALKGFGARFQEKILQEIEFRNAHQGFRKLSDALSLSQSILRRLRTWDWGFPIRFEETGALRRRLEILNQLEFLVEYPNDFSQTEIARTDFLQSLKAILEWSEDSISVQFYLSSPESFIYEWARTTASQAHWEALGSPALLLTGMKMSTEEELYTSWGLSWVPPEARETGEEVQLAREGQISLLPLESIRGVLHNHTTRSDGSHTLEQMAEAALELGYEYLGISDHSQTAVYAQGLTLEVLREQKKELKRVQEKYPSLRIFWGIESDILADGSLDYPDEVLQEFDFVVASIHSRFQMDRETMTARILRAIRNPYTRILGHPTGRLLLGRKPYEVDLEKVIQEAAAHQVAIELNANPARLDIDWRWGPVLRQAGVKVCINPDAHSVLGLQDTAYGVMMARKALLLRDSILNTYSVSQVAQWLNRK